MRLLQIKGDGDFELVDYRGDRHLPHYAILSHTWGQDCDEVTFDDIIRGTGTEKAGYRKITFCAKQAVSDGLQFFWVDTCCINKESSAELQEAINSMFRYYRNAAHCYVFLSDVSLDSLAAEDLAFQKSKWFTRGWTLQELLAPKSVKFYSKEWKLLGSKSSRVKEIAEVTHIPTEALEQGDLLSFTVEQRMAWAKERETTREEDLAYCLLGVFDINMPLIYGERKEKAIKRLHRAIKDSQEEDPASPLEKAKRFLDTAIIDPDVQELFRQRFSSLAVSRAQEEAVPLQPDVFKFISQTPTPTALPEVNDDFSLLMGNTSIGTTSPDLIAVKRTNVLERSVVVQVLSGSSNYQETSLLIGTPCREGMTTQLDFMLTDWNNDGNLDLVMIKKNYTGTNRTEVHIISGSSNYQNWMLEVGSQLDETDETWAFAMGRLDASSRPDLFAIKRSRTRSKTTEVHILSGATHFQNFIIRTDTGLHETDASWDFTVTDWNGDGRPDLVAIRKSSSSGKCTEVHVLSGASMYKEFILRAETPLFRSDGTFEFAVTDWTGSGKPDLVALAKRDTGSHMTEVHVMTGTD